MRIGLVIWTALAVLVLAAGGAAAFVWREANRTYDETWAWPATPPRKSPPVLDDKIPLSLPGSPVRYTEKALRDSTRAVDWRPDEHPPLPPSVATGKPACGFCHGPGGEGRPENASIAGLPADYINKQVAAFAADQRNTLHPWGPTATMIRAAKAITPDDAAQAADYFAARTFVSRLRVVESLTAPPASPRGVYAFEEGKRLWLGQRIMEGPEDVRRFELRDPHTAYVAYVPIGALRRGAAIAGRPNTKNNLPNCVTCHGEGFRGRGQTVVGPPLAGRSPTYMVRQMMAFRAGLRSDAEGMHMRQITAGMTDREMIDVAAYAASLKP